MQLRTTFFSVAGSARRIVEEWIGKLRRDHLWGNDDPLFPATAIGQNAERQFSATGVARTHWVSADACEKYSNSHLWRLDCTASTRTALATLWPCWERGPVAQRFDLASTKLVNLVLFPTAMSEL
jgi:hypothetical protein